MRILPTVVARLIKNAKFVTMKRFLLALLALPLFLGCNDIQPTGKYGIFVNDLLETELKSAFFGGAVANPSLGTLVIPLNQGKYEGGNELVSSVKIANYSFGSQDEKAQIDIRITLKDNQTIDILYSGPAHYDGYY